MMSRTFALRLAENPAISTSSLGLKELTRAFSRWRHSTRDIGGNWQADGVIPSASADSPWGLTPIELRHFFLTALGKRVIASGGGIDWWDGQIVRMEYTTAGQTFVRSMEKMANWTKVIYSKVGDNLLTNGDVEGGAWTQVGTPSTHEASTSWWARGTTSMHVVSDAADEGTRPHAAATVAISANIAYTCSMIVNVVSGTWTLQVDDGSDNVIAQRSTDGAAGRTWLQCNIPDTNAYTTARVQLLSSTNNEEVYADGAVLRTSPVRSETRWWSDSDSAGDYGRIEHIGLGREMTDDEADGEAQRDLAENAWPRTIPPPRGRTFARAQVEPPTLTVSCLGLYWTLDWRHSLTDASVVADTHMATLLDESEFFASTDAIIDDNNVEVTIESTNPMTVWREVAKIVDAGDGSGGYWTFGCFPGFEARFVARPTGTQYEFQGGEMRQFAGGPVNPLAFQPGFCRMADMPTEPTPAGAGTDDDPRRVWLYETWFVCDGNDVHLEWSMED